MSTIGSIEASHLVVLHINNYTAGTTIRCSKVQLGVILIVPAGKHWSNSDLERHEQMYSTVTDTDLVEELDRSSYWTRFSEVVEPFKWQFSVPWKQSQCLVRSRESDSKPNKIIASDQSLKKVFARTAGLKMKISKIHISKKKKYIFF